MKAAAFCNIVANLIKVEENITQEELVKLVNEDLKDRLPKVNVPTLLLWGENDTETPFDDAKIMEKEIPNAGLVPFKGCSHYVFLERPVQINNIIKNFMGK